MRCSIAYSYSEKIADYNNSFRATLQTNIHSCINQGYNSFFLTATTILLFQQQKLSAA